jgi:hypothetical protein
METFDDCFEEAVDFIGAGELEEGAENLGCAEGGGGGREGGGVEVVEEGLQCQVCMWEEKSSWSGIWREGGGIWGLGEVCGVDGGLS